MTNCFNCETEKTPMWRKVLDKQVGKVLTLCNACGIYYNSKGLHRPHFLINKKNTLNMNELFEKLSKEQESAVVDSNEEGEALETANGKKSDQRVPTNLFIKDDLRLEDLNIIRCSNCENINTSIWRRDYRGNPICNACGLFYKKKGYHRVVERSNDDLYLSIEENLIRLNKIKKRNRSTKSRSPSTTSEKGKPKKYRSSSESSAQSATSPSLLNSVSIPPTSVHTSSQLDANYIFESQTTNSSNMSHTLPRISPVSSHIVQLPPISTILDQSLYRKPSV